MGRSARADWFCQVCARPYLWATPAQVRAWVENQITYDTTLNEDDQLQLIEMLAVLTPGQPGATTQSLARFRELLRTAPALYDEIKPFLPTLVQLFAGKR